MQYINTQQIGAMVKKTRKARQVTQRQLALVAGTGLRFISDLENGKPSCEIEKVLKILQALGIQLIKAPLVDKHE